MKNKEELEWRMYGFVCYNISEIQKGIQFGHAVVEYSQMIKERGLEVQEIYDNWAHNHKTFIILNGGTTNGEFLEPYRDAKSLVPYKGSLNNIAADLRNNEIPYASFYEPDLNGALTAVVFLANEKSFDFTKYPDAVINPWQNPDEFQNQQIEENTVKYGKQEALIREIIRNKRLA